MKIYDFNGFPETHKAYGGMAGQKHGIFINGERWLIKYPTRTDFMRGVKIPFTRAPLTEYLVSVTTGETSVAPVYDNAGSFFDKKSDEDFADYLRDSRILHDNAIPGVVSIYKYTKGDRELPIHSFQFMDKHHEEYPMLEDAIIRNSELIDERMEEIRAMIEDIPASVVHEGKEYPIMSDVYKEYVLQILDIRRDKLHELAEEINLQREEEQFLLNGNYER